MSNKKTISLILGIMCILLTYGITIQIRTINSTGTTTGTNETENELRDSVLKIKEKYDNLSETLEDAEKQLEKERENATQNNSELAELENTIKEANKVAGLSEITGQGVVITIDDNKKISSNSWFADPNILIVHDLDLICVINELKNAGAEAISINGQRIVSTSSIECVGNVIKVNDQKIGAPFEIKAIGFQEMLMGLKRFGGYLMYLENDRFLTVDIQKQDKVTIPKYTGVMKFEYAKSK